MPEGLTQISVSGQYARFPRLLINDDEQPGGAVLESMSASIAARYHFGEGWAADLALPVGLATLTATDGSSQGVSGLGDVELGARYELGALWGVGGYNPSLTLRAGVGLPTGARVTTGMLAGTMPNALRIGTGAFGGVAEARYTQFVDRRVALSLPVTLRFALSRDGDGRMPGVRVGAGLEAIFFPVEWLLLRAGVQYQFVDTFDLGAVGTAVNSGGHWLRAEALALFRIGDVLSLGAGARVPFYVNVNGQQLVEAFAVQAVAAVSLGGEEEEEHDHDHGDHDGGDHDRGGHEPGGHEPAGASGTGHGHDDPDSAPHVLRAPGDVTDVATGGASFVISDALADGRVTVIDFWAEWCHPCEHIDTLLRELASEHPSLAVRRVEVPSAETDVARAHLTGDFQLPQVWIYGRDGQLIERMVGVGEEAVRARLQAILTALAPTNDIPTDENPAGDTPADDNPADDTSADDTGAADAVATPEAASAPR